MVRKLGGGDRSAPRALRESGEDLQGTRLGIGRGSGLADENAGAARIRRGECDDLIDQRRRGCLVELGLQRGKALFAGDGVETEKGAVLRELIARTLTRSEQIANRVAVFRAIEPSHRDPGHIERCCSRTAAASRHCGATRRATLSARCAGRRIASPLRRSDLTVARRDQSHTAKQGQRKRSQRLMETIQGTLRPFRRPVPPPYQM